MTAREVYQKNLNAVSESVDEETGMYGAYFVGVFNGWVFDSNFVGNYGNLRKMTEEEFVKENGNEDFMQDSIIETERVNNTVEDFISFWNMSDGECSLLRAIEK